MTEQHGGGSFEIPVGLKMGDETKLGEEAGLGEAGDTLFDVGEQIRLSSLICSDEAVKLELGQEGRGVMLEGNAERGAIFLGDVGPVVEVLHVEGAEERIFRHHRVK